MDGVRIYFLFGALLHQCWLQWRAQPLSSKSDRKKLVVNDVSAGTKNLLGIFMAKSEIHWNYAHHPNGSVISASCPGKKNPMTKGQHGTIKMTVPTDKVGYKLKLYGHKLIYILRLWMNVMHIVDVCVCVCATICAHLSTARRKDKTAAHIAIQTIHHSHKTCETRTDSVGI